MREEGNGAPRRGALGRRGPPGVSRHLAVKRQGPHQPLWLIRPLADSWNTAPGRPAVSGCSCSHLLSLSGC